MIDQEGLNGLVAKNLKAVTGCEVVKANLANAPVPPYPYISFSILRTATRKGSYSICDDGTHYMPATQVWSVTVQGKNDTETQNLALKARDWLEEVGSITLGDAKVVVRDVGDIVNRDTLLTINYEYRKGFDVTFALMNVLKVDPEVIEKAEIKEE